MDETKWFDVGAVVRFPIFGSVWFVFFIITCFCVPYWIDVQITLALNGGQFTPEVLEYLAQSRIDIGRNFLNAENIVITLAAHGNWVFLMVACYRSLRLRDEENPGCFFPLAIFTIGTGILGIAFQYWSQDNFLTLLILVGPFPAFILSLVAGIVVRKLYLLWGGDEPDSYRGRIARYLLFAEGRSDGTWMMLFLTYSMWSGLPALLIIFETASAGEPGVVYFVLSVVFGATVFAALVSYRAAQLCCGRTVLSHFVVAVAVAMIALPYAASYKALRESERGVFRQLRVRPPGAHVDRIETRFVTGYFSSESLYWIPSLIELRFGDPIEDPMEIIRE